MEELFRFGVIRPADRFVASAIKPATPAATGTKGGNPNGAIPPQSFTQELQSLLNNLGNDLKSNNNEIWKRLEPVALAYVLKNADSILSDPLFKSLPESLAAFRDLLTKNSDNPVNAVKTFFSNTSGQGFSENARRFNSEIQDLFLALLILRRGGPSHLEQIIRSNNPPLWTKSDLLREHPSLQQLAEIICWTALLISGPDEIIPAGTSTAAEEQMIAIRQLFDKAMQKTILFPGGLFAILRKPQHGVGFREFHVVKQHIRKYQTAEIGRIENVLKGEKRSHDRKHTLSNENTTSTTTDTTTESDKELTSEDKVDIKNEAQNQVKEDTKVDAGVHAQYDSGGSFKLQADLTVGYDKSSDQTKQFASDVSKDITQKAVSKVKQQVTQSQTTKITETFSEDELQAFDNTAGNGHISGVYQWLEKVYLAQTFNLGKHMILDLMVPEPASSLIQMAVIKPPADSTPEPPPPMKWIRFPVGSNRPARPLETSDDVQHLTNIDHAQILDLRPEDLDPDQLDNPGTGSGIPYTVWIGKYGVTSTAPSPDHFANVGKAVARNSTEDIAVEDEIRLPEGYEAISAMIAVGWKHSSGDDQMGVVGVKLAGQNAVIAVEDNPQNGAIKAWRATSHDDGDQNSYFTDPQSKILENANLGPIVGSVPIGISAPNIDQVSINVEVRCRRLLSSLRQWQLQIYEKIVTAFQKMNGDYNGRLAALQFQQSKVGALGSDETLSNRLIERAELKRSCIAIIDQNNETVRGVGALSTASVALYPPGTPPDAGNSNYPQLPEPDLQLTEEKGSLVRWFEQAFEWENMAYVFYPYFWGRRSQWIQNLNLQSDDAMFLNFLQAGYARVVVPVRLGFEWAVQFYLNTGLPWLGGGLPAIGDDSQNPLYLDIAEEIKLLTDGGEPGEKEEPVGKPWEYVLPTTQMYLRKDDMLPEWHRLVPTGDDGSTYPSDAPAGPWSWEDGAPQNL